MYILANQMYCVSK